MGRIKSLLNKHEFFLKKAKLIIGDGIDLHCGFKTSYSDYFNTNDDRFGNGSLTKAFSEIYQPLAELEFYHANTWEIWDASLFLESGSANKIQRSDIENKISLSFLNVVASSHVRTISKVVD